MINKIKGLILRKVFKSQYRNGHYYSPIPELSEVKSREDKIFFKPEDISGIELSKNVQLLNLNAFEKFGPLIKLNKISKIGRLYYSENGFFNSTDAFFLACMILSKKPKQIIEVGSGYSSALMLDIRKEFFEDQIDIKFIEPYPERLKNLITQRESNIEIIEKFVQDLDVELFESLSANDILFIDSSHIAKVGSDVNHIIFNILPRLKRGVVVHFHDITYPFEYPKKWIYDGVFWNEAYLLKSFLMYNAKFEISLFNSYLFHFHNQWFQKYIPEYNTEGGSIWLEKK